MVIHVRVARRWLLGVALPGAKFNHGGWVGCQRDSGSFDSVCTGSVRYLRPVWYCVRSRDTGDWGSTDRSAGAAQSGAGLRRLLALVFRRLAGSYRDRGPTQGFDRNSHGFSSVCCGNDADLSGAPRRIPVAAITLVARADSLIA